MPWLPTTIQEECLKLPRTAMFLENLPPKLYITSYFMVCSEGGGNLADHIFLFSILITLKLCISASFRPTENLFT